MRKVYSLLAACLLTATTSFGQVMFGIQGSGQMANVTVTPPNGTGGAFKSSDFFKPTFGFRAGAMADIPVTDQLSIRPQLLYSVKGTSLDLANLLGGVQPGVDPNLLKTTVNFNYLELPIQAMYGLDAGPGRVVLGAGPYVAYLLSGSTSSAGQTEKADLTDTKRIDYGLNASVGYELSMGLTLSAYYSLGLANLATDSSTAGSGTPPSASVTNSGSAYHRVFGLSVGYFFGAGN